MNQINQVTFKPCEARDLHTGEFFSFYQDGRHPHRITHLAKGGLVVEVDSVDAAGVLYMDTFYNTDHLFISTQPIF